MIIALYKMLLASFFLSPEGSDGIKWREGGQLAGEVRCLCGRHFVSSFAGKREGDSREMKSPFQDCELELEDVSCTSQARKETKSGLLILNLGSHQR